MNSTIINAPVSVVLETLGCKLNQAETERLSIELIQAGCRIVQFGQAADIFILNTCTVTHIADRKSRHFIRMARRFNPESHIIITGCYAEQAASDAGFAEEVDLVVGNDNKKDLVAILIEAGYIKPGVSQGEPLPHNRTRSFIKAQDGCNNFCSYCIVPMVRGREKSLPPGQVIDEIRRRTESGFKEVVLTGTEIGRYSSVGLDLRDLIEKILDETSISRFRLSSLQPEEISTALLDLWRNPRLCRHFHISVQSGSDGVLQRMKRHYTAKEYSTKLELVRGRLPDAAITTDVIVGFPGETDLEFDESYAFCSRSGFSRLHIFPYSARKGTAAARLPGQINPEIKKLRSQKMLDLAAGELRKFNKIFIGHAAEVLFEQPSGGYWTGLTGNYIRVYVHSKVDLTNRLLKVRLGGPYRDGLLGEVTN